MALDTRQVVHRRDASPDVLLVDAPPVRRRGDRRRSIARVPSGKRMPGEVSMTVSPVSPWLDTTVTRASGVVPLSPQPPAVTPVLAMSTATVTNREVDVRPGPLRVRPVLRLGPASTSVGERVPAVVLSFCAEVGAYNSGPNGGWCARSPCLFLRTVPLRLLR